LQDKGLTKSRKFAEIIRERLFFRFGKTVDPYERGQKFVEREILRFLRALFNALRLPS
jgi:hypothetical protein